MPSFVQALLRPRDLLDAQLEFVNLRLDESDSGRPRMRRVGAGRAAIVLRLPPQHMAEEVIGDGSSRHLPYRAVVSGPSRIAFEVPDDFDIDEVPFTAEALLSWMAERAPLTADPPLTVDPPPDGAPTTVIEFPDRLLLIPEPDARFLHRATPVTSSATRRTAIWHSRMVKNGTGLVSCFRAVDNDADNDEQRLEGSLKRRHRVDIVKRSRAQPGKPHVISSARFVLSALGASATLKSAWQADDTDLLQAWDHDTESGRDRYVRTAEKGCCFPFGHRAALITTTLRRFASHSSAKVAELFQESLLVPLEAERDFSAFARTYPSDGREMPFKLVRIPPDPRRLSSELEPVVFHAIALDAGGKEIACDLTMLFVPAAKAADPGELRKFMELYRPHQTVELGNQPISVADDPDRPGDGILTVGAITFDVRIGDELRQPIHPPFLPVMARAQVKVPALEHLLATAPGTAIPPTEITLHPDYLRSGFQPGDRKRIFAKFSPVPGIKIPAERAGGLAAPRFPDIDGLSTTMGPVSGVDNLAGGGSLTAEQLVGEAQLLGMIPLKKIIALVDQEADTFPLDQLGSLYDKIDSDLSDAALFLTRPMMTTIKRGAEVETRFLWKPKLAQNDFPAPLRKGERDTELILKGRIVKRLSTSSAASDFQVEGKLTHFNLAFPDLMTLRFNALTFKSGAGQKLDFKIDLKDFSFEGGLRFIEEIRKLIPLKSLGGSPIVRPQPDGVVIGYSLPIPAVPLGIFNAQNIALSSSVSIPFVEGRPVAVRFALSERNNPFIISMSIFGGTGYFAVELRTDGQVRVEAAIEFGGIVALDLLVVRGGIYLLAGIYVALDAAGKPLISGYLRFGGYVDVLGLVSVSIEFYIALTYDGGRNVLFGEGRVTVSVKLIFFSKSFSFTVRKEVPGFGQPPAERRHTISGPVVAMAAVSPRISALARAAPARPTMDLQQWRKYCAAFG